MANATIEGFDCTLFFDYDCHRDHILSQLSDDGRIEWLEKRMRMIFLKPLAKIYDRASVVYKELSSLAGGPPMTPMLMTTSLLMNGVEALGSFLTRSSKNRRRFQKFMGKYMAPWTVTIVAPHHGRKRLSEILWDAYRNGLAHSFAILHAGIDEAPGTRKYKISDGVLQIDCWKLFADFHQAVNKMFGDVRLRGKTRSLFLQRFNEVYKC